MTDFDPTEALAAAAKGDQRAWESIVATYSRLVWSIARGFRLSTADASDIYQGTWLRLVEHLDDIRDTSRLGAWLATTARREALTLLRRARPVPVEDIDELGAGTVAPAADTQLMLREEHRELWHAFEQLSTTCQRLLRVLFADPPPRYEEVSAALDMPMGSIGPTRTRCVAHLQLALNRTASG